MKNCFALFPFSQREEQGQSTVGVQAVSVTEPPLLESPMNGPIDVNEVMIALADYNGDNIAYTVESWWDLWQYEHDWKLAPARVLLACFGPDFDNGKYAVRREVKAECNCRWMWCGYHTWSRFRCGGLLGRIRYGGFGLILDGAVMVPGRFARTRRRQAAGPRTADRLSSINELRSLEFPPRVRYCAASRRRRTEDMTICCP